MRLFRGLLTTIVALACAGLVGRCCGSETPMVQTLKSDGVKIAYFVQGKGEPVILIHGWLSSAGINWALPGTSDLLAKSFQVIALDVRGCEELPLLDIPKWQFLAYVCARKEIVLHGSGNPDISEFESRKSNDVIEFGNRRAVYAASDGIWPIYFAVVDRQNYITLLINTCFRFVSDSGKSAPYYYFSVNADALPHNPWRNGTIYLLPGETFEPQPPQQYRGRTVEMAQWASLAPVRPLAKLTVTADDFPFLNRVRGHDPAVLDHRAQANPQGFPWLEA